MFYLQLDIRRHGHPDWQTPGKFSEKATGKLRNSLCFFLINIDYCQQINIKLQTQEVSIKI